MELKTMKSIISKVIADSIAEEMEIEVGDKLISINGTEVKDIIDYKFLLSDEFVDIEIEKLNGEVWNLEIEKEYQEDLGVEFENSILDDARSCCNNCIFCFVDQLPKGMRETLYFKDDDSRLSFLQGNFVTLTNMSEEDIDRIIRYRISPINISVHTTNSELRAKMLNNRFAGNIFDRLKKLSKAGITMNCQIVLCPGYNNGEELIKTIEDLYTLYPSVQNVAGVPVGLTKHRDGLMNLISYSKSSASDEIDLLNSIQKKYSKEIGDPFIRLSDEFYILAEREVPASEYYSGFQQLEDGVGMIRILRDNIRDTISNLHCDVKGSFTLVTGSSAYKEISNIASIITETNKKINVNCIRVINDFFGESITVAGLITGIDIINTLQKVNLGEYLIIPSNMLRSGERIFLDDIKIEEIESKLNIKVLICDYTGEDLIDIINNFSKEE
jgi:putative radical SAM enzyme (TIGR03279 family)